MKSVAVLLDLQCLPFPLNLENVSLALDERLRATGPAGYLGKCMAISDGLPSAVLFAYADHAEPDAAQTIATVTGIIGQAAVAAGGWSLWDALRPECGVWELDPQELPDLYRQLVDNLKLGSDA